MNEEINFTEEWEIEDSKYVDNKELLTIEGASHCDLYDQKNIILFDKIEKFIRKNI